MQRKITAEDAVHEANASPIDELLSSSAATPSPPPRLRPGDTIVGECIDARHPTLVGRVLVRWADGALLQERWMPTLHALAIREGDRLVINQPSNFPEPVVMGVLDGFAMRPEAPREEAARIELKSDEAVRITTQEGAPLVEVFASEQGPVVRLLAPDVDLELPGALRIAAKSIDLAARGEVKIKASDDVVVQGETISLN